MSVSTREVPTLESLRARCDEILRLANQYSAYNVRVFGSVARGEATPESDVDLLVTFRKGVSLLDRAGLLVDIQDLLNRRVDVVSERAIKERLRPFILRDAVEL